jgi:hypothetical protein
VQGASSEVAPWQLTSGDPRCARQSHPLIERITVWSSAASGNRLAVLPSEEVPSGDLCVDTRVSLPAELNELALVDTLCTCTAMRSINSCPCVGQECPLSARAAVVNRPPRQSRDATPPRAFHPPPSRPPLSVAPRPGNDPALFSSTRFLNTPDRTRPATRWR